ncbi:MAG: MarR family transcriptional regulator [Candidatus Omnitrophica bacterium]|nr:MarR family transcriptional regulator [Candidatus Omnitrophota bacterium]
MNVEQFCARIMELMPQIMRGVTRHENNYLSQGKITLPQYSILRYLFNEGENAMSSVAEVLSVSKPSATGTIDRLIAQGLVSRRHDEKDRRIVWITITARGKKVVSDVLKQKQKTMVKIFGSLSSADRVRHLQLFEQIAKILNTSSGAAKGQ